MGIPVVSVTFIDLDGQPLPFTLQMYGIPYKEFTMVPCEWVPTMRHALKKRGIDPNTVSSSPFLVKRVY